MVFLLLNLKHFLSQHLTMRSAMRMDNEVRAVLVLNSLSAFSPQLFIYFPFSQLLHDFFTLPLFICLLLIKISGPTDYLLSSTKHQSNDGRALPNPCPLWFASVNQFSVVKFSSLIFLCCPEFSASIQTVDSSGLGSGVWTHIASVIPLQSG